MAYQTKRQLRAELSKVKQELYDKEQRLQPARDLLDSLGYALEPIWHPVFGGAYEWARPDGRTPSAPEDVDALLEMQEAATSRKVRRETITATIEALGIKGYSPTHLYDSLISRGGTEDAEKLRAERDEIKAAHADKFWADIQTALRVRAERKQSESDDATEAKIAGLFTPKEKPKSAITTEADIENLAERVDKFTERLEAQEKDAEWDD